MKNLGQLMKQAKEMQGRMAELQERLVKTEVEGASGAGMVTAMVEAWVRKPTVADFGELRRDTTTLAGWRRNRVARTLLVFFLSTLGSAIGTYVAGFRIFDHLVN